MYLTQLIHQARQQEPDRLLTVFGSRVRTVSESSDRVARLAGALRRAGVNRDDRVGILAMNSDKYHEYLLAAPWADGVVNPINTRWTECEVAQALCDSDTRVLFVDEHFADMLPALREHCPRLGTVIFCGAGRPPPSTLDYESLIGRSEPIEDARRGGDQLFGVFYTGGTTGRAKGVMLSHRGLLTAALGAQATGGFISAGGVVLHAAPMFHLADLATWVGGMMARSVHVILPKFTVSSVFGAVVEHRVTDVLLVPTMIQLLADSPVSQRPDLSRLRRLIYGSSPIPRATLARARAMFPQAGFTHAYGMTETSPVLTLLLPDDHEEQGLLGSVGRPAPHCENSGRGRRGPRGVARQYRRDRRSRGSHDARLLAPRRANPRRPAGWMDAFRRRRIHERRWLCVHRRPHQIHDPLRGRECALRRGGECSRRASRRTPRGRCRHT